MKVSRWIAAIAALLLIPFFGVPPVSAQEGAPPVLRILNGFGPGTEASPGPSYEIRFNGVAMGEPIVIEPMSQLVPEASPTGPTTIEFFEAIPEGVIATPSKVAEVSVNLATGTSTDVAIHPDSAGTAVASVFENDISEGTPGIARVEVRNIAQSVNAEVDLFPVLGESGATRLDSVLTATVANGMASPASDILNATAILSGDLGDTTTVESAPLVLGGEGGSASLSVFYIAGTSFTAGGEATNVIPVRTLLPTGFNTGGGGETGPVPVQLVNGFSPQASTDAFFIFDGVPVGGAVSGGSAVNLRTIPTGTYDVTMYGNSTSPTRLGASATLTVEANTSQSLVLHPDPAGFTKLSVFQNSPDAAPAGQSEVEIRHIAQAGNVEVSVESATEGGVATPIATSSVDNGAAANLGLLPIQPPLNVSVSSDDVVVSSAVGLAPTDQRFSVIYVSGSPPTAAAEGGGIFLTAIPFAQDIVDPGPGQGPTTIAQAESIEEIINATDYKPDTHAKILRLYRAYFDREPDVAGAKYWIDINNQGYGVLQIAGFMSGSNEWTSKFQGTTDATYVEEVYSNVLGRNFDQAGYQYWLDLVRGTNEFGGNAQLQTLGRAPMVFYVTASQEFIDRYPYLP